MIEYRFTLYRYSAYPTDSIYYFISNNNKTPHGFTFQTKLFLFDEILRVDLSKAINFSIPKFSLNSSIEILKFNSQQDLIDAYPEEFI